VLGIAGALALGKTMSSLLFEIGPRDTATLGIVATMLIAIAFAASLVPTRRATRVDPAEVLRDE
jgi:putative ABC transport system permease protein